MTFDVDSNIKCDINITIEGDVVDFGDMGVPPGSLEIEVDGARVAVDRAGAGFKAFIARLGLGSAAAGACAGS